MKNQGSKSVVNNKIKKKKSKIKQESQVKQNKMSEILNSTFLNVRSLKYDESLMEL